MGPAFARMMMEENPSSHLAQRYRKMLGTIAIILFVLWALGLVTSTTLGGFIHILLVLAIIVVAIRLIQGRSI
jgi:hypothetical protein